MFVIHVTMKAGILQFKPPVQDISNAWNQFCDVLSVAAYKSLYSSYIVFELIRQQILLNDHPQYEHIPYIKVDYSL